MGAPQPGRFVTVQRRRQPSSRQSEYLVFIRRYCDLHKRPPSEVDIAQHLGVSAPAAHQMVLTLEARGLLARTPRGARSLRVLLEQPGADSHRESSEGRRPGICEPIHEPAIVDAGLSIAVEVLRRQFAHNDRFPIDDAEFAPLVRCLLEGFESGLQSSGVTEGAAAEARDHLRDQALRIYTDWCARNDPEGSDVASDRRTFLYLMKHGRWPDRR